MVYSMNEGHFSKGWIKKISTLLFYLSSAKNEKITRKMEKKSFIRGCLIVKILV